MLPSLTSRISSRAPAASRLLQSNVRRSITVQTSRADAAASPAPQLCNHHNNHSTILLRSISHTASIRSQITVDVPSMGDSITEGTIVEWCVPPGSLVSEGDVLALVETDKVTVDIKAERAGVLVKQLGEVEGVVEVGEGLYVLDTDTENAENVTVAALDTSMNVSKVNDYLDAEKMTETSEPKPSASERVPSIHFLGKEGWKKLLTATEDAPAASSPATTIMTSDKPNAPTSITHTPYSSMYGRPPITDDEMEALILGGAEEAPAVKSVVSEDGLSGVIFLGGKVVTAGPRGVWLAE